MVLSEVAGESMVLAMLSEPRLQEMSLPTSVVGQIIVEAGLGEETWRISEHRLDMVIRPSIGLARFTVSGRT